jgi:4,5-DOPA dioxygenase extradiol
MNAAKPVVEPYAVAFQQWVYQAVNSNDTTALLDYRRLAPAAVRAHPTDEHFLPFFVALGAAGKCVSARRINDEITYGALAMDAYLFGSAEQTAGVSTAQRSQAA